MEFASRYFAQIRAYMGGLTLSQRIALGLCSVMIAVSVIMLVQWSGAPQHVPLLDQALTADEQAAIESQLQTAGATFSLENGRVMVPEGDRARLRARLAQGRALPANTSMSFQKLMDENNPFLTREDSRWRKYRALETELSNVLMYFEGISDAKVFVQVPERRTVGGAAQKATASVQVKSRGGVLEPAMVQSIAQFVSGAVTGLSPDAVKIVDAATGRSYQMPGPDDAMPMDVLALRRQREDHYARKITEHLGYIPGVLVGVHADLVLERRTVQDVKLGKPVISEEQSSASNSARGSSSAGPGVKANVGRAVTGGGSDESMSKEESTTRFDGRRDETNTTTTFVPGDIRRLTASINVPRSYFVGIHKSLNPGAADAKDSDLKPIIESETRKIRAQVGPLIAASAESQVEVDWFYDTAVAVAIAGPGGAPAVAGMLPTSAEEAVGMLRTHAPQAGLAMLAVLALVAVLRMARRSQAALSRAGLAMERAARVEEDIDRERLEKLATKVDVAGEALATQTVLEGRELGEDEVRIQHIVQQIGQLVNDDTATASSLVEQWVAASR